MTIESPTIPGADSATPKPNLYQGKKVWGVYVAGEGAYNIWTKQEVADLAKGGVWGCLPIVVPTQSAEWWLTNHGYAELELLVRQAIAWGIPEGSPLCLDIEEGQSSRMNAPGEVARAWAVACTAHKLIPWIYSSRTFLDKDLFTNRWLAEWPSVTPVDPDPPAGYRGWQYHGNDNGIDHDVFLANEIFLSPHLRPVTVEVTGPVLVSAEPRLEGAGVIVSAPAPSSAPSTVGATDAGAVSDSTVTPPAPTVPTSAQIHEAIHAHEVAIAALHALESSKS